jgi:hypothetical protein
MKRQTRICKNCGKSYENIYTRTDGSLYTVETIFCSKSCASSYIKGAHLITKELVEQEIINFVTNKNRYCSQVEILSEIKRSSKTLTKLGIKLVELQSKWGFYKKQFIFQTKVLDFIRQHFDDIVIEYTHKDLLSPKGYPLRVDFFIPSKNLFIEADGNQHYDINNPWYSDYRKKCDLIKDDFAKRTNTNLVRIKYIKKVSNKYLKQCLSNFLDLKS